MPPLFAYSARPIESMTQPPQDHSTLFDDAILGTTVVVLCILYVCNQPFKLFNS